ncbi:MAG: GIY-YIG nuclease family protein [Melioribacteraceae bacterium]
MYTIKVKTKTNQSVICLTDILIKGFNNDSNFICIPSSMIGTFDDNTLTDTIRDAKRYADEMDLLYHRFDDGYYKNADKSDLPYLINTIERAQKLRGSDIPIQLGIDIERIIDDCKEQMNTIKKEEEREQKKILEENRKKIKEQEIGYIYLIKSDHGCKIGKSKMLSNRINTIGIQVPFAHECIYSSKIKNYHKIEKFFHKHFSSKHLKGEWFNLNEDDIAFIKSYTKEHEE